jgi:hypothetical protein
LTESVSPAERGGTCVDTAIKNKYCFDMRVSAEVMASSSRLFGVNHFDLMQTIFDELDQYVLKERSAYANGLINRVARPRLTAPADEWPSLSQPPVREADVFISR